MVLVIVPLAVDTVGDPGKESNASWVIARGDHKKPTYAQMVKASNRVVSEVRKKYPIEWYLK